MTQSVKFVKVFDSSELEEATTARYLPNQTMVKLTDLLWHNELVPHYSLSAFFQEGDAGMC